MWKMLKQIQQQLEIHFAVNSCFYLYETIFFFLLLRLGIEFPFFGNYTHTHSRTRRSRNKRSTTPNYSTQNFLFEYNTPQDRVRPTRSKLIYKTSATLVAREHRSSYSGVRQSVIYRVGRNNINKDSGVYWWIVRRCLMKLSLCDRSYKHGQFFAEHFQPTYSKIALRFLSKLKR